MLQEEIPHKEIKDDRPKRITLKKRRIGLVKKAIQLSMLTGSLVQLKVYNEKDSSLVEFYTNSDKDFDGITKNSVKEYVKFHSKHDKLISQIHQHVTEHGTALGGSNNNVFHKKLCKELDHKNLISLFRFSNKEPKANEKVEKLIVTLGKRQPENLEQQMLQYDIQNQLLAQQSTAGEDSDFFTKYEPTKIQKISNSISNVIQNQVFFEAQNNKLLFQKGDSLQRYPIQVLEQALRQKTQDRQNLVMQLNEQAQKLAQQNEQQVLDQKLRLPAIKSYFQNQSPTDISGYQITDDVNKQPQLQTQDLINSLKVKEQQLIALKFQCAHILQPQRPPQIPPFLLKPQVIDALTLKLMENNSR